MSPFITVLFYMPSGATYSRGCLMDSWGSEFDTLLTRDPEEAIKRIGEAKIANHESKEGSYEITILIDGVDDEFWVDEPAEADEARDALRNRIIAETNAIAQDYKDSAKKRAEQAERARVASLAAAAKRKKQAEIDDLRQRTDETTLEANRARLATLEAELANGA